MKRLRIHAIALTMCLWTVSAQSSETRNAASPPSAELARVILGDPTLREVHRMAQDLLKGGLNAGSGYGEVWIRDLNTFIEVALESWWHRRGD